ncbi:MAG: coproporphyrinogen III oxidase, partial [Puia sp.]
QGELNFESETLSTTDRFNEYIMTSLRTIEGLDLQQVATHFGTEKRLQLEKSASIYIHEDQMILADEKLILTRKGKLFADGIAAEMFFD